LCFYNRILARQCCLFCTAISPLFVFIIPAHLPAVSSQFVPRACVTVLVNRSRSDSAAVRNGPALLYILLIARGPHY
jgi:hypothetical protein